MNTSHKAPRHALVLAAGKGTRLRSEKAKVLHQLGGKPLLHHVLDRLSEAGVQRTIVVVGHEADAVRASLPARYDVEFVLQEPQLGTGHAVLRAAPRFRDWTGNLLVVYGDAPSIQSDTLERLFLAQEKEDADQVLLTAIYDDPFGYGRIIRDEQGRLVATVEEKDATEEQRSIREINAGFYCFKIASLLEGLEHLSNDNEAGEYYLTDLLAIMRNRGRRVAAVTASNAAETWGINTRAELSQAEAHLRRIINRKWMEEGVTLIDPETTYIDADCSIGPDTVIYPGVFLQGSCRIGSECTIYAHSHLRNTVLEDGVVVEHCSVIRDSTIGRGTTVGPFAHVREHSEIGPENRIGNFVEVKKSQTGQTTKAAHLAYLGDAVIGSEVNIGAGTITCNYDGLEKHRTVIEDEAFIGSDSQLVAPVTVRRGAYVAAGSTITQDVPEYGLGIARGRQANKEKWAVEKVEARRLKKKKRA